MRCLGLVSLLLGCGVRPVPEGTPQSVADKVRFCADMDSDVQDWCVLGAVQTAEVLPGQVIYELCRDLRDSGARDACFEYFSRLDTSIGREEEICSQVQQQRLRESCWLSVSERVMRSTASIEEVASACRKAGTLEAHCLSHLPAQRQTVWMQNGGFGLMYRELETLLTLSASAADMSGLGFATGVAANAMGGQSGAGICRVFGQGEAGRSCQESFMMAGQSFQGSTQAPLSSPRGQP